MVNARSVNLLTIDGGPPTLASMHLTMLPALGNHGQPLTFASPRPGPSAGRGGIAVTQNQRRDDRAGAAPIADRPPRSGAGRGRSLPARRLTSTTSFPRPALVCAHTSFSSRDHVELPTRDRVLPPGAGRHRAFSRAPSGHRGHWLQRKWSLDTTLFVTRMRPAHGRAVTTKER